MVNSRQWSEWEESALAVLRRGHTGSQRPITSAQRLIFILIFPARECAESWTVFWDTDAINRQQRRYVSYLRWRRDIDLEKFGQAGTPVESVPTVEYKEAILEDSFVDGLLEKFKHIAVPALIIPKSHLYLDGTIREAIFGDGLTFSHFRWCTPMHSDEPQPEWKELGKAVREAVGSLRKIVDEARQGAA